MQREELEKKISKLKSKKKLQPKEIWELKKLQKELEKIETPATTEPTGIFINDDSYQLIDIDKIETNPYQNRTTFDEERIKELSESIEEIGLLQPVVVAKNKDNYTLVSGERRLRAYKLLQKSQIPSLLKYNLSNSELEEMALVENLSREDIDIYDETQAISRLHKRGLSYSQIATKVGKSKTHIARMSAISQIEPTLLQKVAKEGVYKPKLLEQIAKRESQEQDILVDRLCNNNLSLKELEATKEPKQPQEKPTKELQTLCDGVIIKAKSKDKLTIQIDTESFDYDALKAYLKEIR
jgi:ParB family chromosome partitioning protein